MSASVEPVTFTVTSHNYLMACGNYLVIFPSKITLASIFYLTDYSKKKPYSVFTKLH